MGRTYQMISPIDGRTYDLKPDPDHGFLRTDPWPEPDHLAALYERYDNPTVLFNEFRFTSLLEDRLGLIDRPWRICEVGCGDGALLQRLRDKGHEVTGFEPSEPDFRACRDHGLDVAHAFFTPEAMAGKPKQDLFILINVLEHVPDPETFLKELAPFLADDTGYVLVLVPNEFSRIQDLLVQQEETPYFLAPPIHLSYFDIAGFESLVRGAGFDPVHRTTDFPMEFFVLSGRDYRGDPEIGKACHAERVAFERNLFKDPSLFWDFYDGLAQAGIGREIISVIRKADRP